MMTRWLPEDEPSQLPTYATHYVGVGGFVLNDQNELLVVSERYGDKPMWKLPGGHANRGEDLGQAAIREVFEETGIESEFISLTAFRHQHKYLFETSDLYFVCRLKALSLEIKHDPREISACRWLPLDQYIADPSVSYTNKHIATCIKLGLEKSDTTWEMTAAAVPSFNRKATNLLYCTKNADASQILCPEPVEGDESQANAAAAAAAGADNKTAPEWRRERRRSLRINMQMQAERLAKSSKRGDDDDIRSPEVAQDGNTSKPDIYSDPAIIAALAIAEAEEKGRKSPLPAPAPLSSNSSLDGLPTSVSPVSAFAHVQHASNLTRSRSRASSRANAKELVIDPARPTSFVVIVGGTGDGNASPRQRYSVHENLQQSQQLSSAGSSTASLDACTLPTISGE
ncbi:NUDIX domain-containing protein, variant 2 [Capsaspora owczarzaki ATCC 30864]|nr:NUDIX domain-containing protein, variant 1 [Capsaspora owczarzaki ATCC 30864]KJE93092.1 NUDIX domain-containing protein, variant 2 [Capsaspora owczarzaki ATCC 30864]